jgi:HSP20 family protein
LPLPSAPRWRPDADVYETAGTVEILLDLAGVDEDAVDVQIFEDVVTVEGHRRLPPCDEGAVFHAAEIRQGPFHAALPLPARVDPESVRAVYERGILALTLPKLGETG